MMTIKASTVAATNPTANRPPPMAGDSGVSEAAATVVSPTVGDSGVSEAAATVGSPTAGDSGVSEAAATVGSPTVGDSGVSEAAATVTVVSQSERALVAVTLIPLTVMENGACLSSL